MTLQQFLIILRVRYAAVLLVLATTLALASTYCLLAPKQYTATAAVILDVKSPDPVTGIMLPGLMSISYMATQIDIINSDRTARAVVKALRMEESAALRERWREDTGGKGVFQDWLAQLIQRQLDVKPSRESNLIDINYSGSDPDFAAAVANAFAQSYIDVNLDLRLAPARQYASFFEAQTKSARTKLEAAQSALSAYQQSNGITASDDRLDYETAKLNETSSQLTGIQAQTTDSMSKRQSSKADTVSEVMSSPLINGLKSDVARLEARLNESNVNLGKNHPQTTRLEAELATLKAQLEAETRKITSSIDTTYQVSKQREQQLQAALAVQKNRVLLLNKQRDELNVLKRELESAQRAFDVVSQRASQTNIESQTTQTNISVLNPAFPPAKASKPRVLIIMLVATMVGILLGIALALMLELAYRRARSVGDLEAALGVPVLGSISSAAGMFLPLKKRAAA